jgi:hypothetical protein
VVHPVLVNVCQLLGYLVSHHSHSDTWVYFEGQTGAEAEQALIIFDVLQGHGTLLNPTTQIHVYSLLLFYYIMKGDVSTVAEHFGKLGDLVVRNLGALRLDDTLLLDLAHSLSCCARGPAGEALSAFSLVIFLELGRIMVWKLQPVLDPSIFAKFRQLAVRFKLVSDFGP